MFDGLSSQDDVDIKQTANRSSTETMPSRTSAKCKSDGNNSAFSRFRNTKISWNSGPDQGYSWVVVLASFFAYLVVFGLYRCSGLLFVAIIRDLGLTREEAAWPFTLTMAIFQLSSPLASVLTQWMSFRKVCFLSTTMAAAGIACCYFATNMLWINLLYGGVQGFGLGTVMTLIPVRISQYFVRHRITAMGFAMCGASVSTFVFPRLVEYLLEEYGLQGTFLICGGMMLNLMVVSAVLRDPEWIRHVGPKESTQPKLYQKCDVDNKLKQNLSTDLNSMEVSPLVITDTRPSSIPNDIEKSGDFLNDSNKPLILTDSAQPQVTILPRANGCKKRVDFVENGGNLDEAKYAEDPHSRDESRAMTEKSSAYEFFKHVGFVLRLPMFYVIACTFNMLFTLSISWFMVILDFAKDKGIPNSHSIYVLTAISATEIIGRIGFGWVTDKRYITKGQMLAINLVVMAILQWLYPYVRNVVELSVLAAFQGLSLGCTFPLFVEVQVQYIGPQKLALVLGITNFFNGTYAFFRPPFIGLFRDVIGSYDWMFNTFGILCITCAAIWIVQHWMASKKSK